MDDLQSDLFETEASAPIDCLALIYDLEGFSRFFSQPDAHLYVPRYLNTVTGAISRIVYGGGTYWVPENSKISKAVDPLGETLLHRKFLGDGELLIWKIPADREASETFLTEVMNRFWNLNIWFSAVVDAALEEVPVYQVPRRIRIGIARGPVYELKRSDDATHEYIGHCINLASRLQSYCPDLSFIASAGIRLSKTVLSQHRYRRIVAKKIRGLAEQIVIVDTDGYASLSVDVQNELFTNVSTAS